MSEETLIWKGTSSPLLYLGTFIICGLAALLIIALAIALGRWWVGLGIFIPAGFAGFKWLVNQLRVYELTTQRLRISTGILNRKTDELELYRVKDITLLAPLQLRVFGLGNIVIISHDETNPKVIMEAIPKVESLRENLRNSVEICREKKRVRLAEFDELNH
jgi:membrane protein YdbS with pleckstrin-like domain